MAAVIKSKAGGVIQTGLKTTSAIFGWLGAAASVGSFINKPSVKAGVDVVMSGVAFIPVVGWAIAGSYFVIDQLVGWDKVMGASLFQTFNLLAVIFLVGGLFYRRDWRFSKMEIILLQIIILAFDYIRIYWVIKFKNILQKYSTTESRKVALHPALYYIISILILVVLRLIGFFPEVD